MSSFPGSHFLAVATLLDQLDPKEYNWTPLAVLLRERFLFIPDKLLNLIGMMKANIEFSRIESKFLIDKDRAGSLRVNSQMYMNLTLHLLKFLSDRCVYNPHTLIHTNTNA